MVHWLESNNTNFNRNGWNLFLVLTYFYNLILIFSKHLKPHGTFSATTLLFVRVVSLLSDFELSRHTYISKTRNRGPKGWTVLIPPNTINKPENMLSKNDIVWTLIAWGCSGRCMNRHLIRLINRCLIWYW